MSTFTRHHGDQMTTGAQSTDRRVWQSRLLSGVHGKAEMVKATRAHFIACHDMSATKPLSRLNTVGKLNFFVRNFNASKFDLTYEIDVDESENS